MLGNFNACYDASRISEGGYVNHPADNGGPTNFGVTQMSYNRYRRREGKPLRDVRQIEQAEVRTIYQVDFWDECNADHYPKGLDFAVFDFALNSGPSRAVKYLQKTVNAKADGKPGPLTIKAVQEHVAKFGVHETINDVCDVRLQYMRTLDDWPVFGKGWTNRVDDARATALAMA